MAKDPVEQAVETAAELHGVTLEAEWLEAATTALRTIAAAARLVEEFPLEDEAEYAPVFRA